MRIMQGDQYSIPFEIEDAQGEPIAEEQVDEVEFVIDSLRKSYPTEVQYADGQFLFPLTQEESFEMESTVAVQIRVKFSSGDIVGTSMKGINVHESISKEVL